MLGRRRLPYVALCAASFALWVVFVATLGSLSAPMLYLLFLAMGLFGSAFVLTWDGVTVAGNKAYTLPNGQYRATLTVLKALGDASNPAHVETWTSPVITIARP